MLSCFVGHSSFLGLPAVQSQWLDRTAATAKNKREAIIKRERQNGGEIESNRKDGQRKSKKKESKREMERVVERHQTQSCTANIKDPSGREMWRVRRESVRSGCGIEAKVQVKGSPQLAGAGAGTYRPVSSPH